MAVHLKWAQQKAYVQEKLSKPETATIYRRRKTDVELVFGFLES